MTYRSIFQDAVDSIGGLLDDEIFQRGLPSPAYLEPSSRAFAGDINSGRERLGTQDGFQVGWKLVDHLEANGGGRTNYGEPNQSLVVTAYQPDDYLPRDLMRESLEDLAYYSLLGVPAVRGGRLAAGGARSVWRAARDGRELQVGRNARLAPFGNRTGHPIGKYPHYHRRRIGADGKPLDSQGIGRHRPWETKPGDGSWWDRF